MTNQVLAFTTGCTVNPFVKPAEIASQALPKVKPDDVAADQNQS